MPSTSELKHCVQSALEFLSSQPGVREIEVFAASNRSLLTRLNYTSHIPCNGVEEPKSTEMYGLGVQAVFDGDDGMRIGFGSEPSDLGLDGARRALAKARAGAVHDPEFRSLPKPTAEPRTLWDYHDPRLLDISDTELVEAGWRVITGSLRVFVSSSRLAELVEHEDDLKRLGLILGGDVTILQERIAIASTHMPRAQIDETTLMTSFGTAMVEARDAKGTGWSTCTRLDLFTDEGGTDAAANAIAAIDGERVPTGEYTVILGKQPVADLMNNLVIPACQAGSFYASATPFLGKLGKPVAVPSLSIYDHGAMPGFTGSKGITCEGLPTGRTDLIKDGVLVGMLSHWYESQRLLNDPMLAEKVGVDRLAAAGALVPRNGFRFDGTGRSFEMQPGTSASNVILEGAEPVALDALLATVRDGLYIGRIWYTYAINGLAKGDFTCTVVGDSYVIRDGRLVAPIKANAIRINDNITRVLTHIIGVTKDAKGTVVWASDEVVYAPEIAVARVRVDEIAGFMEGLA